jgi:hypothetical protein
MTKALLVIVLISFTLEAQAEVKISAQTFFSGVCDASAGAALDGDLFAAADDETNRLRIYSFSRGGEPLFEMSVNDFLRVDRRDGEADIEGAARIGDVIYWIGSHARNQKGELRSSRQRLFATRIASLNPPKLEPVGHAYEGLLQDLEQAPELEKFDFDEAAELAPKEKHALNIEGLCAGPDGSLLIGFRNPVPKKKALLVPLLNPAELTKGAGIRAHFGKPIRLELDGLGIRDIVETQGKYYLIAGAHGSANRFRLFEWDGQKKVSLLHQWEKHALNPEAILALPGKAELLILTDERSKGAGGKECKDLPRASRRFRGVLVEPALE